MAALPVGPSMEELATQAGAGSEILRYLRGRGLTSTGAFAMLAQSQEQFDAQIVAPLLAGWQPDPATDAITVSDDEKPIARAVLRFMWTLAREARARVAAASSAPLHTPPAQTAGTAATSSGSSDPAKVPKHLPPGEWRAMIDRYNAVTVNGEARSFPEHELLGAESVVARVLYEHRTSKLYSPVGLGEVLQRRSFQSNGEVNPLAKRARTNKLSVEDGVLKEEAANDDDWAPRGYLSLMDGLNSIRWLYILCEVGSEQSIHSYFDWMIKKSRMRGVQVEQFQGLLREGFMACVCPASCKSYLEGGHRGHHERCHHPAGVAAAGAGIDSCEQAQEHRAR